MRFDFVVLFSGILSSRITLKMRSAWNFNFGFKLFPLPHKYELEIDINLL